MADSAMVRQDKEVDQEEDLPSTRKQQPSERRKAYEERSGTKVPTGGMPFLSEKLTRLGYDKKTVDLMMSAWRPGTKKVYTTYLNKWAVYCVEKGVDLLKPELTQACLFLRQLADQGLGYGALNAARSALSTILPSYGGETFGSHRHVCWLLKGVYEKNPPQAKYKVFWDVKKVFMLFKTWGRSGDLSLKWLSLKLTVLLLLVTSQRGQTILSLTVDTLDISEVAVFRLKTLLKHNRLGDALDTLVLKPFDECYRLCVVCTLKEYLKRTAELRGEEKQLLLTFQPPHRAISRDTLARWTLRVLELAGIDTGKYGGHSTRGASASAARRLGMSVNLIMKQAGWKAEESFAKYYNKDLEQEPQEVGRALLQSTV